MGPGPARGGADDAPLSPYVTQLIRRKAAQLSRSRGYVGADRSDLIQELTARLLAKSGKYDSSRGASRDTFADRTFVWASLASAMSILLATEMGFLQRLLDTVELTGNQWLICIGAGAVIVVVSEIRKFILRQSTDDEASSEAAA